MLALAYAAAHPDSAGPLALIGCGTFDSAARERLEATLAKRTDPPLRRRLQRLHVDFPDPDERLEAMGDLLLPLYSYDPASTRLETESCDARAHHQTWEDMVRLQDEGLYPAAFAAITSPVLMLHGAVDPHPGRMIRAALAPHLPQLEYCEWERCGHYPWLERAVRDEFFTTLRGWLMRYAGEGDSYQETSS
jgi:pimeloyl-ACP methyl ester carboxylesterase